MPTLNPCLFSDRQALGAAEFYVSVFPESRIDSVARAAVDTPFMKAGEVLSVDFTLLGGRFVAIAGGAQFPFSEAISFQVMCADQAEVDHYWAALLADGGTESRCGWLKDRFGMSWQVIPEPMMGYIGGPDPAGSARATQAMLGMVKLDLETMRRAYEGEGEWSRLGRADDVERPLPGVTALGEPDLEEVPDRPGERHRGRAAEDVPEDRAQLR